MIDLLNNFVDNEIADGDTLSETGLGKRDDLIRKGGIAKTFFETLFKKIFQTKDNCKEVKGPC